MSICFFVGGTSEGTGYDMIIDLKKRSWMIHTWIMDKNKMLMIMIGLSLDWKKILVTSITYPNPNYQQTTTWTCQWAFAMSKAQRLVRMRSWTSPYLRVPCEYLRPWRPGTSALGWAGSTRWLFMYICNAYIYNYIHIYIYIYICVCT